MSTQISTDLERLRTWLAEHSYHDRSYQDGRAERDDALRCFAIELSVNLRYTLADSACSADKKLERIAADHADFERNCEEAKTLFKAWMTTPAPAALRDRPLKEEK